MKTFKLKTEYITLGQLLKAANIISSGGEARNYLQTAGVVLVNGEEDNRRGRKLRLDDEIHFPTGEQLRIIAP